MKDEKALEKCYEGKLLGNNNEMSSIFKNIDNHTTGNHYSFELL